MERQFALAREAYDWISGLPDFECPLPPEANILCFRICGPTTQPQFAVRDALIAEGSFHLSTAEINGERYLRAAFMNPDTTMDDVRTDDRACPRNGARQVPVDDRSQKRSFFIVRPRTPFFFVLACLALIPGAPAGAAGPVYIPVISKGIHQQFWQDIMQGALKASRDYNVVVTFDGPENASMVDAQVDQLSAVLEKKPSAVCIDALDSAAVVPLLEAARKEKVPVIAFDAGVDSSIPVTTAATDNFAAAELAASKLAALVGGTGKIGLIGLDPISRSGRDRRDGFLDAMKKRHPGITIIGPEYSGGDQLRSADLARAMIQANPDIRGFFGASEGTALGIAKAVQDAGSDPRPVVVGFDSGKAQIDAIRGGLIARDRHPGSHQDRLQGSGGRGANPPGRQGPPDNRHGIPLVRPDECGRSCPGGPAGRVGRASKCPALGFSLTDLSPRR